MWQSIAPGAGAGANAGALPTLLGVVCSRTAAIPSPLLCQQVGKPGHRSDLVCKHTYGTKISLGCCSFCMTWAAVLHGRLWGTLAPPAGIGIPILTEWRERSRQDQALHGERARLEANSPASASHCLRRWVTQGKDIVWWLCAFRKGDTLLQHKEIRSGEEGVMGQMGTSMNGRWTCPGL